MVETFHKWINSFGVGYDTEKDGTIIWDNFKNKIVPTKSEIDAKRIELTTEYDSQEYARSRKAEYPPIADQQDMQFHDAIDGTTTWQDAIQAVKTKYPKSE